MMKILFPVCIMHNFYDKNTLLFGLIRPASDVLGLYVMNLLRFTGNYGN